MRSLAVVVVIAAAACSSSKTAAPDAPPALDTTPNQWVWVEVPGTTCANGSPAGFGLNRSATPGGGLFVYFEGGGACWDAATCSANPPVAINLDVTYDQAHLTQDAAQLANRALGPPLDTASFVFVPYCTGDLHAGTQVMAYPGGPTLHHMGGTNAQRFVETLAAGLPAPATIWVTGSSAGGYGATLDFHRVTAAWPAASVHLLEDSSPFIPLLGNYDKLQAAWKIAFPPACTGCDASFTAVFDAVTSAHPTSRIGLMTWDDDAVIKAYFGYTGSLVPIQDDLIVHHLDKPNTKVFEAAGTSHTMFGGLGTITSHGVALSAWFTQWLVGDAGWATVRP